MTCDDNDDDMMMMMIIIIIFRVRTIIKRVWRHGDPKFVKQNGVQIGFKLKNKGSQNA